VSRSAAADDDFAARPRDLRHAVAHKLDAFALPSSTTIRVACELGGLRGWRGGARVAQIGRRRAPAAFPRWWVFWNGQRLPAHRR